MPGILLPNGSSNGGAGRLLRPILSAAGSPMYVRPGWYNTSETAASPGTGFGGPGLLFFPFYNPETITYTGAAFKVSTASAGTGRCGIYNCDTSSGLWTPTTLISDIGSASTGSTGNKVVAGSFTLEEGWYCTAYGFSGNATLWGIARNNSWIGMADRTFGDVSTTNGTFRPGCVKQGAGYDTALPADAPSGLLYGMDTEYNVVMLRLTSVA